MNILVCIKQVPEFEQIDISEDEAGQTEIRGAGEYQMNRFDEFAVEAAVRIKEGLEAVRVDVLTVGPKRAGEVVKRALGMGADHGIHIETPDNGDAPPSSIADRITAYAGKKDYQVILTGSMSEDGMNGQVGPMIAGGLSIPAATQVIFLEILEDRAGVYIEREIEGGHREMQEIGLPCVLAVQTGANRPRYPSLSNLLRANSQELETIDAGAQAGEGAPREAHLGYLLPRRKREGKHLSGTAREKALALSAILTEKAFIRR